MAYELGIIGAGNMAEAIVRGVLSAGVVPAEKIIAADVSAVRREVFTRLGVAAVEDPAAAGAARVVLLSVKPQQMEAVLETIAPKLGADTVVVSIAAGISIAFLQQRLGAGRRIIRTMPNTPMLVGEGMVGLAAGASATAQDVALARKLFEAAATVVEVPEGLLDAVTAVSGSGPAYFFFMVEQMERAGVELGLSAQQAHVLATRTALGAAKMLVGSSDAPAELRRKVTSPGGTTQAAIGTMEAGNWPKITVDAIKAAANRSRELGK